MELNTWILILLSCCIIIINIPQNSSQIHDGVVGDNQNSGDANLVPNVTCNTNSDSYRRRRRQATIIRPSSDRFCYFRVRAMLHCQQPASLGSSASTVWQKLQGNDKWSNVANESTLIVNYSTQGYYRCLISNCNVTVSSNVMLAQKFHLEPNKTESTLSVQRGQIAAIDCHFEIVPKNSSRITWNWTNSSRPDHSRILNVSQPNYIQLENGTLLITSTSVDDSGIYYCSVEHIELWTVKSAGRTTLVVEQTQAIGAGVNLMDHPIKVTAVVNQTKALLWCIFENRTAVDLYSWTLSEVEWSFEKILKNESSGMRLDINHPQLNDSGEYVCTGRYKTMAGASQELRGTIQLIVNDAPRILQPMTSRIVKVQDSTTFTCKASGRPLPAITWYINARPLTNQSGTFPIECFPGPQNYVRWTFTTGRNDLVISTLKLTSFSPGDVIVSCNASNEYGYQQFHGKASWITASPVSSTTVDGTSISSPSSMLSHSQSSTTTVTTTTLSKSTTLSSTTDMKTSSKPSDNLGLRTPPDHTVHRDFSTTLLPTPSVTQPSLGGVSLMIIIIVVVIATITTILTAAVIGACFCLYTRRKRSQAKQAAAKDSIMQQQQLQQIDPLHKRRPPTRSSSIETMDSGIDDFAALEADDNRKPLKAVDEEADPVDDVPDEV